MQNTPTPPSLIIPSSPLFSLPPTHVVRTTSYVLPPSCPLFARCRNTPARSRARSPQNPTRRAPSIPRSRCCHRRLWCSRPPRCHRCTRSSSTTRPTRSSRRPARARTSCPSPTPPTRRTKCPRARTPPRRRTRATPPPRRRRTRNESGVMESSAVRNSEAPGEMNERGGSYGGLGMMDRAGTKSGKGQLADRNPPPDDPALAARWSKMGIDNAWKDRK